MRPKSRRRPDVVTAETFAHLLDPGRLIPHDYGRFHALCAALFEANGGRTTGSVCTDVLALFLADLGDPLTDYLAPGRTP